MGFLAVMIFLPLISLIHAILFLLDNVFFPRLHSTAVTKPVFIIGHARSGTTLMHRLMMEDEEHFSAFRFYEMLLPSLIEKKIVRALARLDAACFKGAVSRRVAAWEEKNLFPDSQDVHKLSLTSYEEDDQVLLFSMAAGFWIGLCPFAEELDFYYIDKLPERKRQRLMRYYKACVKRQLYLSEGSEIHLSKNPVFAGRVEALIETFPDARFLVMMRNPLETVPSLLKLLEGSWQSMGWNADAIQTSLAITAEQSFHTYHYPQEVLQKHPDIPHVIVDYRQLVQSPRQTVENIYASLDIPLSPACQQKLSEREQRSQHHETTHTYNLEEFGLDKNLITERLEDMFAEYKWPIPIDGEADGR